MIRGEKRDMWWLSQPNIVNNSMKTHRLKHRHDRRREKRHACGGYLQHANIHQTIEENSPAKTCMQAKL